MTAVLDAAQGFTEDFGRTPGHARPWVNALRARGMAAFQAQGFPSTKLEEWRDTNVAPIAERVFVPAAGVDGDAAIGLAGQYTLGAGEAAAELVFINGRFDPHLSTTSGLPRGERGGGVRVVSLEQAFESDAGLLERHLGQYARIDAHPFAALNTGFVREGALVHLAKGAVCERPIHLLFLSLPGQGGAATVSHPRVLLVAEEESECSVVETYAGAAGEGGAYLTNAVTEIVLADGARLDHNKLQQEGDAAYHTALMQVMLGAASQFVSHSTSLGSRLARNDLAVFLGGEGAEATLNGLVYARGEQHIDNHTLLHHEKGAQKTDSKQTSKALLLSDTAFMNSQPALEIYADDVKCTHGSTTGPVDANAVFYLVSRGLSLAQARHLMTYAFAADITRRIRVTPVRARIEDFMAAQHGLPQDLRITDEARHDVALL